MTSDPIRTWPRPSAPPEYLALSPPCAWIAFWPDSHAYLSPYGLFGDVKGLADVEGGRLVFVGDAKGV